MGLRQSRTRQRTFTFTMTHIPHYNVTQSVSAALNSSEPAFLHHLPAFLVSAICHLSEWLFASILSSPSGISITRVLECYLTLSPAHACSTGFIFALFLAQVTFLLAFMFGGPLSSTVQLLLIPLTRPWKAFFLLFMHFRVCYFLWALSPSFHLVAKMTIWSRTLFPSHRSWLFHFIIIFYHTLGHVGNLCPPTRGQSCTLSGEHTVLNAGLQESPSYFRFLVQTVPAWAQHQGLVLRLALSLWNVCFSGLFTSPRFFSEKSYIPLFC